MPANENKLEYAPVRRHDRMRALRQISGTGAVLCFGLWFVTRFAWWFFEQDQSGFLAIIQLAQLVITLLALGLAMAWLAMTVVALVRRAG